MTHATCEGPPASHNVAFVALRPSSCTPPADAYCATLVMGRACNYIAANFHHIHRAAWQCRYGQPGYALGPPPVSSDRSEASRTDDGQRGGRRKRRLGSRNQLNSDTSVSTSFCPSGTRLYLHNHRLVETRPQQSQLATPPKKHESDLSSQTVIGNHSGREQWRR